MFEGQLIKDSYNIHSRHIDMYYMTTQAYINFEHLTLYHSISTQTFIYLFNTHTLPACATQSFQLL